MGDTYFQRPTAASASVAMVHQRDRLVIVLSGELDIANLDDISAAVCAAVDGHQRDVDVDLRDVDFMGAAALGLLAKLAGRVADDGARLRLRNARPIHARMVQALRLDPLIDVETAARDARQNQATWGSSR